MAKRNKGIRIPVSDEELEIIRELAEEHNLSMATYLRNLGLRKQEIQNLNKYLGLESSPEKLLKEQHDFYIKHAKSCSAFLDSWDKDDYNNCVKLTFDLKNKAIKRGYDISNWEEIEPIKEDE